MSASPTLLINTPVFTNQIQYFLEIYSSLSKWQRLKRLKNQKELDEAVKLVATFKGHGNRVGACKIVGIKEDIIEFKIDYRFIFQ